MTVKQYLKQIGSIQYKLERIRERLRMLNADIDHIKSPDYGKDRIVSSASGDQMINMIIKCDEEYSELMREQGRLLDARKKICEEIEQLGDDRYKRILFERYVALRSWDEVASVTGYDPTYVFDLHGKALGAFAYQHRKKLHLKTS